MIIEFTGNIIYWRGPAPYHYVTMPEEQSLDLHAVSGWFTYGWGCIPVTARIGKTEWKTSLFPKNGRYLVPIKNSVRDAENLELGDDVTLRLVIRK